MGQHQAERQNERIDMWHEQIKKRELRAGLSVVLTVDLLLIQVRKNSAPLQASRFLAGAGAGAACGAVFRQG